MFVIQIKSYIFKILDGEWNITELDVLVVRHFNILLGCMKLHLHIIVNFQQTLECENFWMSVAMRHRVIIFYLECLEILSSHSLTKI